MRELPAALAPMEAYGQFIIYIAQPSQSRPGKTDKYPCDFRSGHVVSAHDPAYWTDAGTAIAAAATFGAPYGVGFVFTESDPFWFLDLDGCLLPDRSDWTPLAKSLCSAFPGAAIEVSQSGEGLHIFGTGRPPAHKCKNEPLKLEFYHSGRFVALTGTGATGNAAADFSHILPALVGQYFPADPTRDDAHAWTDEPVEEWRGPTDDDELIRRALRSQSTASAFGGRASFADLWTANLAALSASYPDDTRGYNGSQADAALAQHLAFWTGNDCERIVHLMNKSALVRDKWEREDYLRRTILGAVSRQFEVLTDKEPEPVAGAADAMPSALNESPRPVPVSGATFVGNDDQLKLFSGCVYVQDIHRVLVPGGLMLKPEQFKVAYGGYTFTMDNANEKTSRDAWETFTQSQTFRAPRANSITFKPGLPAGAIIEREGQTFVNTYWPVEVPRKLGDPGPFLTHLRKLLPNDQDALILLAYMAACVQHKGVKFQWAPVLQGVEGNGKTLFTRCVAEAVGKRYVHLPKASQLSTQFNGWMVNKIFYGVEDIYVPDSREDVIEALKPMITGEVQEIENKGVDQRNSDICGNFIFNSNHRDCIKKTANDRRFCMLFTAQQCKADIARDGFDGDYFPTLYAWLRGDGYAIVSELLYTWPIPDEYNPATKCQRAPTTSTTYQAIAASTGGIEQEIHEAIAQGLPGFCGGWISSIALDRLLEGIGAARRMKRSKRREMLEDLGYVTHPALSDGRVNNVVLPDAGKPRLFVYKDSPARAVVGAAEAAKAYEQANNHNRIPFPTN